MPDSVLFTITLLTQLYLRIDILLTCIEHLHDRITSLTDEVWAIKTSLTPPLFIVAEDEIKQLG